MLAASGVMSVSKPDRATTVVVALLAVAVFINYVDRGVIATAAPMVKDAYIADLIATLAMLDPILGGIDR